MAALMPIVITGPESSGKSSLAQILGSLYDVPVVKEYARWYLERYGKQYDYARLCRLAQLHQSFQSSQLPLQGQVFLDTDMLNYFIWSREVFGEVPSWIRQAARRESQHRYLLTSPDLPWQEDQLRENPHNREVLFEHHRELLERWNRPYRIISGTGLERVQNAVKAVEDFRDQAGYGTNPKPP